MPKVLYRKAKCPFFHTNMTITQVLIGLYFTGTPTSSTALINEWKYSLLANLEVTSSKLVRF